MKTLLILITIAVALGFLPQSLANSKEDAAWKKIVLLQSTRSDVERLLGKSKSQGYVAAYDLEDGHLFIQYSPWNYCDHEKDFDWNVPKWTVLEIAYSPYKLPRFSSLKIDLKRFQKVRENPCCPDLITYRNAEEGVAYTVLEPDGKLNRIDYFPSSRYDYLRCKLNGK